MRPFTHLVPVALLLFTTLPSAVTSVNIVLSNDDGWAELNVRQFYKSLTSAGQSVVLSAPAIDQSGRSSLDAPPQPLNQPCQFNSCPKGSPATGSNATEPRYNYVNSYPVTAIRYGISVVAPKFFKAVPDLAVAGPNVGANVGAAALISGTVGAATEAAKQRIPSIAFSGTSGKPTAWNAKADSYNLIYSDLATNVTTTLIKSAKPYLPNNAWLNVNFPAVDNKCAKTSDFKFVLSRIYTAVPVLTPADVSTCGKTGRLPNERDVVNTKGCYASISVGLADTKLDADAITQAAVLAKLKSILSCLPA
ncbi:sure-like protein [Aulographum hederae CBS 113979]|uniref:Sure-like protein n=1 Tax=Aulographum hederae CBS 113979 TaxID=1176131 RepID=A0A6G1GXE4_9PEZI|nr:sure-like protein [Aulographum hederae CBS 113979]